VPGELWAMLRPVSYYTERYNMSRSAGAGYSAAGQELLAMLPTGRSRLSRAGSGRDRGYQSAAGAALQIYRRQSVDNPHPNRGLAARKSTA
jgi:hypothetical protein